MAEITNTEFELQYLKGIGPKRAELLAKYNLHSFEQLINFFPRKYADRSNIIPISKLMPEMEATVIGKIEASGIRQLRRKIFYIIVSDESSTVEAVWFNSTDYFKKLFQVGQYVALSGKVAFYRGYQFTHPDYDVLEEGDYSKLIHSGKIISFYPESENLKKRGIASAFFRKVFLISKHKLFDSVQEFFPAALLSRYNFLSRAESYHQIHMPASEEHLKKAVHRFKYEDFFFLQIMLAMERKHLKQSPDGIVFDEASPRLKTLYESLPFQLTEAQKKVIREIRNDMKSSSPMNRLLQGDVGSGKTLVALMAMLIAADNGYQSVLMAPTEILAEQHFLNISKFLKELQVPVSLLTGNTKAAERSALNKVLAQGKAHIVIGTHALVHGSLQLPKLGLSIVDEQHRFGVLQRGSLRGDTKNNDVLVMTATPIPRTLAMTAYGSLDVSIINELPAGRKKISTSWRFDDKADKIYEFISAKLDSGEQAYLVYPLVEESDKLDLKAAIDGFEYLSQGPFKKYRCGLLHGRMKAAEKEQIMHDFKANIIQILVTTTVVEVGVDVANATIMVIEHAERFGLAQLHQLRGRVGRGEKKSYCIIKTPYNIGDTAQQRMKIMTESQDGFVIAEMDLKLRGWGDFFSTKQSGMPDFRIANPIEDREILEQARTDAFDLVERDPFLREAEHQFLKHLFENKLKKRLQLAKIS